MILTNLTFIDDNNVVVGFITSFDSEKVVITRAEIDPLIIERNNESEFIELYPILNEQGEYDYYPRLKNNYQYFEYTGNYEYSFLNYTYDADRNSVIPPCPVDGYILDNTTLEWKPDPAKSYDINNDGNLYRYNEETMAWYPVN